MCSIDVLWTPDVYFMMCCRSVSRFGSCSYCEALDISVTRLVSHCIARCSSHVCLGLFKHSYGRTCVVWTQTTLSTNPLPQPLLLSRDRYSEHIGAFPFKVYSRLVRERKVARRLFWHLPCRLFVPQQIRNVSKFVVWVSGPCRLFIKMYSGCVLLVTSKLFSLGEKF
jgi:hypothetical protein